SLAVTFLSMVFHGHPVVSAAVLSTIATADACVTALLVRRRVAGSFTTHRLTDILVFIVAAGLVPMVSGSLGGAALHVSEGAPFLTSWREWWLAESIGMLLGAPLAVEVIAERRAILRALRSLRSLEFVLVLISIAAVTEGVFGEMVPAVIRVPSYVLPFLLWGSIRFGPGASSAIVLTMCLVGMWNTAHGLGPY